MTRAVTLNVIGAGRVGTTVALLLQRNGLAQVSGVVARSHDSAESSVRLIGHGSARTSIADLKSAKVHMITVPDAATADVCAELAASVDLRESVVFHCSGVLSSEVLDLARRAGASVASVHPIKAFADPELAADSFAGTRCGIEGDTEAVNLLSDLFDRSGAELIELQTESKALYHSAMIFGSGYLVGMIDIAKRLMEAAGVSSDDARDALVSLARGTVDNVAAKGTAPALTGPVPRGDASTVTTHLEALRAFDPTLATTYADMAQHLIGLARIQGTPEHALSAVSNALTCSSIVRP